ncbi:MAG: formylglycine-generating enzyme family protein [Salinibacter sp.]
MRFLFVSSLFAVLLGTALFGPVQGEAPGRPAETSPVEATNDTTDIYTETIPETLVEFDMVRVPGGSVTIDGTEQAVDPFWIARAEVQWDAFDTYRLDEEKKGLGPEEADAISLPSKPYGFGNEIPGFGQEKYPVLSVTRNAARQYARWLSARTDRTYRLPTAAQWKHACKLGYGTPSEWSAQQLAKYAWFGGNAGKTTHPSGKRAANDLGVYDQLGNAAELVAPPDGETEQPTAVWGGSYQSAADDVHCSARRQKTPAWQESDPQLPKSKWWLSDAQFVGFRVVRAAGGS